MKITQHIPSFCSGFERNVAEAASKDEILKVEWVDKWSQMKGFNRFSKHKDCLMAELHNGAEWWVVAFMESPEEVDLPEWKNPSYDEMIADTVAKMNSPRP